MRRSLSVPIVRPSYGDMTPAELRRELERVRETRNRTIDSCIRAACDAVEKRLVVALEAADDRS